MSSFYNSFEDSSQYDAPVENKRKQRALTDDQVFLFNSYLDKFQKLEDEEERECLANTFFKVLCDLENLKYVLADQLISRIIDLFLSTATIESVIPITKQVVEDLRMHSVDKNASHVVQALLGFAFHNLQGAATDSTEEIAELQTFLTKVSKFMYNNIGEFIVETSASYVLRTVLEIISGVELPREIRNSAKCQTDRTLKKDANATITVPEELKVLLPKFTKRLCQLPDCDKLLYYESVSAVFQSIIYILGQKGDSKNLNIVLTYLVTNGFEQLLKQDHGRVIDCIFQGHATCRLLEAIIPAATAEQQQHIFTSFFKEQLGDLMCHQIANHSVQKLCSSWKNKETFSELFDLVTEHFEKVCDIGYTAVLFVLAQNCRRLKTHKTRFVKAMKKLFQCESEAQETQLALCLLYLQPCGSAQIGQKAYSLHGSLVLQEMLSFKSPSVVVDSILSLAPIELSKMACDTKGSHVVDAFVRSTSIDDEKKQQFIDKFEDLEMTLACSKCGSRSIESLWGAATIQQKMDIGNRLLAKQAALRENRFGQLIYSKFMLRTFNQNSSKFNWQNTQLRANKKRKLMDELLEEAKDTTHYKKSKMQLTKKQKHWK